MLYGSRLLKERRQDRSKTKRVKETTMLSKLLKATACLACSVAAAGALAAEPIRIGLVSEITGPNAEAGANSVKGATLAMEEINRAGGVLGRQLELKVEDNQSTNPGSVLAVSKLANEGGLTALIAPVRSTQVQAAAPTIAKMAVPTFTGATDYGLTHSNNSWLFRARPNDSYSAKVLADFGANTLKAKKWAVLYSTNTFGQSGKTMLLEALSKLGITPVLVQGYTDKSQDFTPIVLAIKQSGADILASYTTFDPDTAIFATQFRQFGLNIPWIGSATLISDSTMKLGKEALHGVYAAADFFQDASPEAKAFATKYKEKYKQDADFYGAWSYDAMNILAKAITQAKSTAPDAIRKEILAIRDYKGAEGTFNFDKNGDGLHGYNIVKNDNGKVVFVKTISIDQEAGAGKPANP
jgi:branched-chain amino acid transport system substrate-binding protein